MSSNLEEANFLSIVMRMATGAYIAIGAIEDPVTGKKKEDVKMAQYLIDSLRILQEKTNGNLEVEEEGYLDQIIADLELKFVKIKEKE